MVLSAASARPAWHLLCTDRTYSATISWSQWSLHSPEIARRLLPNWLHWVSLVKEAERVVVNFILPSALIDESGRVRNKSGCLPLLGLLMALDACKYLVDVAVDPGSLPC